MRVGTGVEVTDMDGYVDPETGVFVITDAKLTAVSLVSIPDEVSDEDARAWGVQPIDVDGIKVLG